MSIDCCYYSYMSFIIDIKRKKVVGRFYKITATGHGRSITVDAVNTGKWWELYNNEKVNKLSSLKACDSFALKLLKEVLS